MKKQKQFKNAIFAGECMIEISGDISSLCSSNINMKVNFGGDTFNSAVYFSRLCKNNFKTFYFTAIGNDKFSEMMMKRFEFENLDTSLIKKIENKSPGLYSIHTNKSGNRSFSYWRNNSAAKFMLNQFNDKKMNNFFKECELFYYSGISSSILEEKYKKKLIQLASQAKITAFDFNFRKNLHSNLEKVRKSFIEINELVNVNFVSFDDIIDIFGQTDPFEFVKNISRPNNIILLRLQDHIIYSYYGTVGRVNVPIITAKDKTAAGDSFNGSFLAKETYGSHMKIESKILKSHELTREVIKYKGAIIPKSKMPY